MRQRKGSGSGRGAVCRLCGIGPEGADGRKKSWPSPAATACGCSVRTAWGSSPPRLRCRWSRRSPRHVRPERSRCPVSRGRWGLPCSTTLRASAWGCPVSYRWETAPTSRRRTSCNGGRTIPRTAAVLLHVEQFGDPRTFARTARRVSARKPLVAVHPDDSRRRRRCPRCSARPGSPRRHSRRAVRSCAAACDPAAAGRKWRRDRDQCRRSGGVGGRSRAGAWAAHRTNERRHRFSIRGCAPAGADISNPIDLTPHARCGSTICDVLERVLSDDNVDAVLTLFVPPLVEHAPDVAAAIAEAAASVPGKPMLASYLSRGGVDAALTRGDLIVPTFVWPESAAVALGRVAEYARWRAAPAGVVRELPGIDHARAECLIRENSSGWLDVAQATALLDCFGIRSAADGDEAAEGRDTVVTVSHDPVFGPIVSFGVAGDYIDLFDDVAVGSLRYPTEMQPNSSGRSGRSHCCRANAAGGAYDVPALEETLLRVSALVEFLPRGRGTRPASAASRHRRRGGVDARPRQRIDRSRMCHRRAAACYMTAPATQRTSGRPAEIAATIRDGLNGWLVR